MSFIVKIILLKIGSLRLHAAQAYSRHIFEHKINAV